MTDNFRGDNANLIASINALLALDAEGALVPHGVGGHARALLSAAASRLAAGASEGQAEWRDVPGFEEAYEASSAGEIRSKETGKLLPKNLMGKGYVKADLWRSGIRTQTSVHRVIATTFHGPSEGREVNHIDGDKQNNAASNLEWVTRSENEVHSRYVLGNLCIPVLAEHIESGARSYHASIAKAAEELGLRDELVRQCVAGKRKWHNGYRFISVSSLEQLTAPHPSAEIAALRERIAGMEKDAKDAERKGIDRALDVLAANFYWSAYERVRDLIAKEKQG